MNKLFSVALSFSLSLIGTVASSEDIDFSDPKLYKNTPNKEFIDLEISPSTDFYQFANGGWLKKTKISKYVRFEGLFQEAEQVNFQNSKKLIAELLAEANDTDSNVENIRRFHKSVLNKKAVKRAGLKPFKTKLNQIASTTTFAELVLVSADPAFGAIGPIEARIFADLEDPKKNSLWLQLGRLSMGRAHQYSDDSKHAVQVRQAYRELLLYIAKYIGIKDRKRFADSVITLETKLATFKPSAEVLRDNLKKVIPSLQVNTLTEQMPAIPWAEYIAATKYGPVSEVKLQDRPAINSLYTLALSAPIESWQAYMQVRLMFANVRYLPNKFQNRMNKFFRNRDSVKYGKVKRSDLALVLVKTWFADFISARYAEKYLSAKARLQVSEMANAIKRSFRIRFKNAGWQNSETLEAALLKLDAISVEIGGPDRSSRSPIPKLSINKLFENIKLLRLNKRNNQRLSLREGRNEDVIWTGPAASTNPWYDLDQVRIFIPAGIIQPHFFYEEGNTAYNFGLLGSIIGHEISHAFDDVGKKYDHTGALSNWWGAADEEHYDEVAQKIVQQYKGFEALPGKYVNPHLTLGENIADIMGAKVSLDAFLNSCKCEASRDEEIRNFYIGLAHFQRYKIRDTDLASILIRDPHTPPTFRIRGIVQNMDSWYEAFNIGPQSPLYLPPSERVSLW